MRHKGKLMGNIIALTQAQANRATLSAPVMLRQTKDGQTKTGEFDITAYTGAVVDRWWGKLAIDVDGITAKDRMPIFREHAREVVVGYSLSNRKEAGAFHVYGKFSGVTDAAKEVQALAEEGFPWQASIGVRPLKILSLDDGVATDVNGHTVAGPAEIWLESEVFETSFVALGADDNTQVACFSQVNDTPAPAGHNLRKEHDMEITLSLLESKAPELLAEIRKTAAAEAFKQGEAAGRAAGAADELARIQAVSEQAMPGHEALAARLMFDGKTTGPEAAVQILAAEKKIRQTALDNLDSGAPAPVTPAPAADPAPAPADPATADEFSKNKDLVEEFGDYETYAAFKAASDKGLVRILTGKKGA
jgi:hypothetical protein